MPMEKLAEIDVLRELARSVIGKAKHHAPGQEHLVLTLTGALATYHDAGTLKPGAREGHQLTSCWFDLKGVSYFLSYRDQVGQIRSGGKQGHVDLELTEATTGQDVFAWFDGKGPVPGVG